MQSRTLFAAIALLTATIFGGPARAATSCDIADPILPCEIGGIWFDAFAGNYTQNRSFFKITSYTQSVGDGTFCLTIKAGRPHSDGFAYNTARSPSVWTSPEPYSAAFGVFGAFGGSCIKQDETFELRTASVHSPLPAVAGHTGDHVIGECLFGGYCARDRRTKAHSGIDLTAAAGTPVYALCDGKVEYSRSAHSDIWSRFTIVRHPTCAGQDVVWVYYGHVDPLRSEWKICPDDGKRMCVDAGQRIGTVAQWTTEAGDNSHLHLGLATVLFRSGWGYFTAEALTSSDCTESSVNTRLAALSAGGWLDPALVAAVWDWSPIRLRGGDARTGCSAPEQDYVAYPIGTSVPYVPWTK